MKIEKNDDDYDEDVNGDEPVSFDQEVHMAVGDDGDYDYSDQGENFNENGIEEEFDGERRDTFDDYSQNDNFENDENKPQVIRANEINDENSFSYFGQSGNNWAGPEHWKLKRILKGFYFFILFIFLLFENLKIIY